MAKHIVPTSVNASGLEEISAFSPAGIDSVVMLDCYTVRADRATGAWLGEPELIAQVEESEWHARQDTDDTHFDTYEAEDGTRAIEVVWAD